MCDGEDKREALGRLLDAVPAATVQRLACDASVRRVLLGPDSAVIDVGRALRVPSGAARAALRVRDGGCVWPGCDRPSSWTNAHDIIHWSDGGPPSSTTSYFANTTPGVRQATAGVDRTNITSVTPTSPPSAR